MAEDATNVVVSSEGRKAVIDRYSEGFLNMIFQGHAILAKIQSGEISLSEITSAFANYISTPEGVEAFSTIVIGLATGKTANSLIEELPAGARKIFKPFLGASASPSNTVAKKTFDISAFADEIVAINKATDGGGVLLNGTPSSAIFSAMYYEDVAEQGAAIFRSISGGHMFVNGNKRTAVAAFKSFAKQNGLNTVSEKQMMNIATQVATGEVTEVSQIAKMLTK